MIENKTVIGGLIISLVALITFGFVMSVVDDLGGNVNPMSEVFPLFHGRVAVEPVSDTKGSAYGDVDIQYPRFRGAKDAMINSAIEKTLMAAKADFLKSAEEGWTARVQTAPSSSPVAIVPEKKDKAFFETSWTLVRLTPHVISLKISTEEYTFGAHPSESIVTYNFDIDHQKFLTLADIYAGDPDYLSNVSKASIASLLERFGKNVMFDLKSVKDGAGPDVKNFSSFTTDGHIVTVYFQTYQVGPRPFGQPTVDLPILSQ